MYKTPSKFLTSLALTAAALCALLGSAQAQNLIFGFDNQSWQYYQAGNQPPNVGGVDWKATNYNDVAWSTGFGVFAYEPDSPGLYPPINTTLNRSNATAAIITYYFRTRFIFPTNPATAVLVFTNLVDDGAAVYLNGQPLYSIRMPGGTPAYGTFATGGPAAEGNQELNTIAGSPLLRQGTNVLAVELHDTSGSSDVAWGLGLSYGIGERAAITRQPPASIVAPDGDEISLSVGATGQDLRFAWFRNNVFIAGQTNDTLNLINVTAPAHAGTYHVIVSNVFNSVRSSNSVLVVVPDTFGPCVVAAYVEPDDTNRVFIDFNEDPARVTPNPAHSSTNGGNYVITEIGTTNRLVVTNAQLQVGAKVIRLMVETNFNKTKNYQLCLYNLMDARGNQIALNSCVPLGLRFATNGSTMQDLWSVNPWEFDNRLDSMNWKAYNFVEDPEYWTTVQAMVVHDQTGGGVVVPCTTGNLVIQLGPTTYYYRRKFNLTTNEIVTNATASLTYVIDDGAVFYLNGVEIRRFNMPPSGQITYGTRPVAEVNNAVCNTWEVDVGHLLTRSNILAVEVHQFGSGLADQDTAFDLGCTINYTKFPRLTNDAVPNTVRLRTARPALNQMRIFWTNGLGYALESRTNLTTPWLEVQPPNTNLTVTTTNKQIFYRLRKRH